MDDTISHCFNLFIYFFGFNGLSDLGPYFPHIVAVLFIYYTLL